MRTYTVLRDLSPKPSARPRTRTRSPDDIASNIRASAPPEPKLETATLRADEVSEIARDTSVSAVAPVMRTSLIRPLGASSPDAANEAWGNEAWGIAAVEADKSPYSGRGVVVAVLDTGIDKSHAAFPGISLTERDFSGLGDGDKNGHGTHCAGTIFGRDVNGVRIGIARGVEKVLAGKVLTDDGGGNSNMLFSGLQWAAENGAHVISMSVGFDFTGNVSALAEQGWPVELATSSSLEAYRANLRMFDALMQMMRARAPFSHEPVIVAATGNESKADVDPEYRIAASLPAAAEGVVSVGALRQSKDGYHVAPFSNAFPQLSAPGVNILSACAGERLKLVSKSGTSMACPHVAGVAALWWEALRKAGNVPATGKSVIARMIANARANVFAPGALVSDRGNGLVTAPR
jgi:subtilisin family serine protease